MTGDSDRNKLQTDDERHAEIIARFDRLERAVVGQVERKHFTTEQAAARLNLTAWTVRQACNTGRIKGSKPNGRSWHVPLSEVERIEREGGLGPASTK